MKESDDHFQRTKDPKDYILLTDHHKHENCLRKCQRHTNGYKLLTLILLLQQRCCKYRDEEDAVLSLPTSGGTMAGQEDSGAWCAAPCSPGSSRARHPTLIRPNRFRTTAEGGGWAAGTGRVALARAGGTFPRGLRAHLRLPPPSPRASLQWSLCTTLRKDKRLKGCYLESLQRTLPARENEVKP